MARVDSGHETVTSEEEEDSPTPRHSPLITMPSVITDPEHHSQPSPPSSIHSGYSTNSNTNNNTNSSNNNDNCSQCKFTSRRFPITCENDLFRLASCTHNKTLASTTTAATTTSSSSASSASSASHNAPFPPSIMMMNNRSSSAVVCGEYSRRDRDQEFMMDSIRRPPPKLTGVINSIRPIIRPIAFKPTEIGGRLHPNYSSMKQSLERRNSENFFEKRRNPGEARIQTSELSIPSNHNNNNNNIHNHNNQLNSQRFGGSLCNVLPSKEFCNKNGSTLHIEDVGITPLGKMCELTSSMQAFDPLHEYERGLDKGFGWEAERAMYESHLRAAHQRSIKIQQDRRKLHTELDSRTAQLEEAEWAVCLLKAQLKDCQGDQVTRCHEVVQLRSHVKNLASEVTTLRAALMSQSNCNHKPMERENVSLKQKCMSLEKIQRDLNEENEILRKKLAEMELKHTIEASMWEKERVKWREQTENWREEQNRVLRYQKALQHNYVMTCQKAQNLSLQLESLNPPRHPSTKIKSEDRSIQQY